MQIQLFLHWFYYWTRHGFNHGLDSIHVILLRNLSIQIRGRFMIEQRKNSYINFHNKITLIKLLIAVVCGGPGDLFGEREKLANFFGFIYPLTGVIGCILYEQQTSMSSFEDSLLFLWLCSQVFLEIVLQAPQSCPV